MYQIIFKVFPASLVARSLETPLRNTAHPEEIAHHITCLATHSLLITNPQLRTHCFLITSGTTAAAATTHCQSNSEGMLSVRVSTTLPNLAS